MSQSRNLKLGVVFSYITMAAGILVSLTYTPFLLQMLGQQQYGIYNLGQSAVSYLGLAEFGFGSAVVRYVSKYRAEGNAQKTAGLYGLFFTLYNILAAIVLAVGAVICVFSDRIFTVSSGTQGYMELKIIIAIMVVNMTFSFATTPYSAIITAHEDFIFLKVTNLIYTLLKPVVMIPLLIWGYRAVALSVVTLALTVALNLANVVYVKRVLRITVSKKREDMDFSVLREILGYSFFIFLGTITAQLNDNTDNIILGIISGETAVAVYAVGYQLNSYIQQIPGVISSVFFPRVTARITNGATMEEMSDLMIRVGRLQFYAVFLLCSGFCLFGKEFIALWAGEGYEEAYWITVVLILPAVVPNIQSLGVMILQAMNKHRFKAILYVICAALNVVLSIPAGLAFGPVGCAVCTGITTLATRGIAINFYYHGVVKLNMRAFWRTIAIQLTKIAPVCALGVGLNCLAIGSSWIVLAGKILIYSIAVCVHIVMVCFTTSERNNLKQLFNRRRAK